MLAEISAFANVDAVLIAGRGGVFDVAKDGVTIFSKFQLDRFPVEGEIGEMFTKGEDE